MELKKIVLDSNKSLREKSAIVKSPYSQEDINTCRYLFDYLVFASDEENSTKYDLRPGVGLAAPQIGINKRMLAVYIWEKDENGKNISICSYALINPKIISHSSRYAYLLGGEGCLSVNEEHQGYR